MSQPTMQPNEKTAVTYRTYESERLTGNNTPDLASPGKQTRPSSPIHFPNVLKSPSNSIKRLGSSSYESRRHLKESQNLNLKSDQQWLKFDYFKNFERKSIHL